MTKSTLEPGRNGCSTSESTEEVNLINAEKAFRDETGDTEGQPVKLNHWYNEWRKQAHFANTPEKALLTFRSAFNLLDVNRAVSGKGFRTKETIRYLENFLNEQAESYKYDEPGLIHRLVPFSSPEEAHIANRLFNLTSVVDEHSLAQHLNWSEISDK